MLILFLNYVVDYDGDGKKDIWGMYVDVFVLIVNFFLFEGWVNDGMWGRQVLVIDDFDYLLVGFDKVKFKLLLFW